MSEWQPGRILTAAQFIGRSLVVQVMTVRRSGATVLDLSVRPKFGDDPDRDRWQNGSRWSYPPTPPVWPLGDVDPWEWASCVGPLASGTESGPEASCRSCGAERIGEGNYCGHCGNPFDSPEIEFAARVARIVADVVAQSPSSGAELAALIADYAQPLQESTDGKSELLELIKSDFTKSASASFLRGEPATVTPDLTLAIAQDIHESVANAGRVRPEQIHHAEMLLRNAPLTFGYWGPFKALVKSVPVDDLPDAYADALARLSSPVHSYSTPPPAHVENVGFLSEFVDAASQETLVYLSRRARRDLATLADRSPDAYARVASRMILAWDSPLSRAAFAPAYVMLGARSPLDAHSKHVVRKPDMSSRRDPHPEIWNDRPELVQEIFDSIDESVEALTWSYQVLESLGQAPAITVAHLDLALLSTYPPLTRAAIVGLSSRPGQWDSLTVAHWAAIFRNDDPDVDAILDALAVGKPRPAAVEAALEYLKAGVDGSSPRTLLIAVILLSANQPVDPPTLADNPDAFVAALVAVIIQGATRHRKLWTTVIQKLELEDLKHVRYGLFSTDAPRSAVKEVSDLLQRRSAENAAPAEAITWIASSDPVAARLGWQLLDEGYGMAGLLERLPQWISRRLADPETTERIVAAVFDRAKLGDAPQLAEVVEAASDRGVDPGNLLELLMQSPLGSAVAWRLMAGQPRKGIAALVEKTSDALRRVGDSIQPEEMGSANPGQLLFVLSYIKENSARIAGDEAFGLAAALSTLPELQSEAVEQLRANGQLPGVWFTLAESNAPLAIAGARDYLANLTDGGEFRDEVIRCLDSGSAVARALGNQVLRDRLDRDDDRSLWTALAESDDPRIEAVLAVEPHLSERVDDRVLAHLDRRVIALSGRGTRKLKDEAKSRIQAIHTDSGPATRERIGALLDLARGQTLKDKEWALEKLAELALAGLDIKGLEVSLVTKGDGS